MTHPDILLTGQVLSFSRPPFEGAPAEAAQTAMIANWGKRLID